MAVLTRSKTKGAVQGKSTTLTRIKRVLLKLPRPIKSVLLKLPESTAVTDANLVSQAASQLQREDKRQLGQEIRIPRPNTVLLKRPIRKRILCSNQWDKRGKRHYEHHIRHWQSKTPVYRLKGVRLKDLAARSKNVAKEMAQATMDAMVSWESDGASGVFQDELGNPLLAYFAQRHDDLGPRPEGIVYYEPGPNTPSAMGRSPADFAEAENKGKKIHFDGIDLNLLNKTLVSTQLLVHHLGIRRSRYDGRHDMADTLLRYVKDGGPPGGIATLSQDRKSFTLHGIEYVYHDNTFTSEATGVIHLVHAWPDQGRSAEKYGIHPSADMVSSAHGSQFVHKYFEDTEGLASLLGNMLQASFPEFYLKYEAAFKAGKWTVVDPGPFLGRAVVWKLNVMPHQDGLDDGPAVIFPMGRFSGGECYLPDLKLKLSYRPGEVIILMAGALYHAIGKWAPLQGVSEHGITPGRVGNVFFFPRSSFEVLQDKPAGWALDTAGGLLVDLTT